MATFSFFFPLFFLLIFQFQHYSSSSFSLSVENYKEDIILSSPKPTFTAGFYPVGENAYTFAIWFTQKNIQNATVVWMANRDQPVNGKQSTLSLDKTGNLILTDARHSVVWSTKITSPKPPKPLKLILHDTGNLVLYGQNNSCLWQSFDFPTDTLLPDQNFTRFTKLVSSRNEKNHSTGFYKLLFNSENILCLLYEGPQDISSVYWPNPLFSIWDAGRSTYNSSKAARLDRFGKFTSSDKFTLTTYDYGSTLLIQRRLKLDHDGNVRVYSRNTKEQNDHVSWLVSGQFHHDPCRVHGICGHNSICSYDPSIGRKCTCLPGFRKIDKEDWSQGCKANFQLQLSCNNKNTTREEEEEYSRFLSIPNVDLYGYDQGVYENFTYKKCEDLCFRFCECVGFQHRFLMNRGYYNCYPKTRLLNGYWLPSSVTAFFLRLPKKSNIDFSHDHSNSNRLVCSNNTLVMPLGRNYMEEEKENGSDSVLKFILWFVCVLGEIEVLGFIVVWCFLRKNRKQYSIEGQQGYVLAAAGFRKFRYSELKQATKGFSKEIGKGAGGTVYKGVLSDNRVAAIKRLHEHELNQGESEFLAEVGIIGRLNHMNLIDMWGYCAEGKHRLLVYEYMENGTLADNLSSNALDWDKRYNIAVGTARGLAYLHEECLEWILHCDIKPQNILLDSNYQPKVADFGLSKLLNRNDLNNSNFSRIRGTRGYMAPEWIFNFQITSKVDVYSYGIVVLEMLTGKSPTTGIEMKDGVEPIHERLVTWVREKRRNGSEDGCSWVEQIVDPKLGSDYDMIKMESLAMVALDCVAEDKDLRPNMRQVVEKLLSHEHDT